MTFSRPNPSRELPDTTLPRGALLHALEPTQVCVYVYIYVSMYVSIYVYIGGESMTFARPNPSRELPDTTLPLGALLHALEPSQVIYIYVNIYILDLYLYVYI